jgi:hypothetical protein
MLPTVVASVLVVTAPATSVVIESSILLCAPTLIAPEAVVPAMVQVIAPVIRLESPALMAAESILMRIQATVSRVQE